MYEQRFGLHRKPFQTVTKAQDFFASSSFNELLPSVLHALQTDLGVAVLTGPAGVGKSVSLEQIQRQLESTAQTVLLRGGSLKGSPDLLYMLHRRLLKLQPDGSAGSDSSATDIVRRYEVVERLERVASFWGPLTILLDDAQLVNQDVFSELRSLLEEGHDGRRFARLLIAGPLLLEEVLADSANSHFARKIRTHSFLQPLRSDEAIQYLDHHFTLAGGQLTAAFDANALELIVAAADGVPQCLNLLADESLMVCEEAECDKVTRELVTQALERLQHLPYSWNVSMVAENADEEFGDGEFDDRDFGASSGASATDNSIEIGEFPSETFSETGSRSVTSDVAQGVFEIGAPSSVAGTVSPGVVETDEIVDAVVAEEIVDAIPELKTGADFEDRSGDQTDPSFAAVTFLENNGHDLEPEALEPARSDFARSDSAQSDSAQSDSAQSESTQTDDGLTDAVKISENEFSDLEQRLLNTADELTKSELLMGDQSGEASGLAEFVDGEDEVSNVDVATSEVSESMSSYEPWAPAGQWPSEPLAIDVGNKPPHEDVQSMHMTALASDEIAAVYSDVAEPETIEPAEVELVSVEPIWDHAATPVVDRFTWAELGRETSESAEAADCFQGLSGSDSTSQFAAAWPPMTTGVAPASQIPVSELDDEYAELLNDLGLLIEATSQREADFTVVASELQPSTLDYVDAPSESVELLASANGPDGTIEELQQLIHEEQRLDQVVGGSDQASSVKSPDVSSFSVQEIANEEEGSEPSNETSHSPMASPRFFSMSQAEVEGVDGSLNSDSPWVGVKAADLTTDQEAGNGSPDGGASFSDGDDPDVVAFQQVVEERDEWLDQETLLAQIADDEQAEQERAMPGALRQARRQQRRSVLTMGLRQAAGAETVSELPAVSADEDVDHSAELTETSDQDGPISLLMPESRGSASGSDESKKTGFSNLFTRLRRRRRGEAS